MIRTGKVSSANEAAMENSEHLEILIEVERDLFGGRLAEIISRLGQEPKLDRVRAVLEQKYDDPGLTLQRAAKETGASQSVLKPLIRQATGFPFHQFLIRYRMLRAISNVVGNAHCTLLMVAIESGFGTLETFERNCRRLLGKVPSQFQEESLRAKRKVPFVETTHHDL